MNLQNRLLAFAILSSILPLPLARAIPEAFEINKNNFGELPGGKEADGIVGDFILRNDLACAVISQNSPNRKANMGTFWGPDGATPGCLYDLDLLGANNDQLTIFSPLGQQGDVSYVRTADDCEAGALSSAAPPTHQQRSTGAR